MDPMEAARFEKLMLLRSDVTRAIEPLRQSGEIGHSLDTRVTVYLPEDYLEALEATGVDLTELCIVSQARTRPGAEAPADALAGREVEGLFLEVQKAAGEKCPRCWNYSEQLGESPDHPDICPRCARVVSEIEAAASHEG
jgi:isoleucyl-tRNA synthetase